MCADLLNACRIKTLNLKASGVGGIAALFHIHAEFWLSYVEPKGAGNKDVYFKESALFCIVL